MNAHRFSVFLTGKDALENTCNGQDPGMEACILVLPSTEIVCMRACVEVHTFNSCQMQCEVYPHIHVSELQIPL